MSIRRGAPIVALVLAAFAAACGEKKIEKAELEEKVKTSLAEKVGQEPKAIQCPGDLAAEVDAKTRCVLVAPDDSEVDVDVRVSSVDGDNYKLDIMAGTEVRR
jgi:Domain of unknown function (DUF4333)